MLAPKTLVSVLGAPDQMVCALSKAVAKRIHTVQLQVVMRYTAQLRLRQHATFTTCLEAQKKSTDSSDGLKAIELSVEGILEKRAFKFASQYGLEQGS